MIQHYKNRSSFEAFRQCQAKTKKPFVSHPRFYHPKGCPPQRAHLSPLSGIRQCTVQILFSPSVRRWMRMEDEGATADGMYVCTVMYAPDCNSVRERPSAKMGTGAVIQSGPFPFQSMGVRCNQAGEPVRTRMEKEERDVAPSESRIRVLANGKKKDSYSPRTRPPV